MRRKYEYDRSNPYNCNCGHCGECKEKAGNRKSLMALRVEQHQREIRERIKGDENINEAFKKGV